MDKHAHHVQTADQKSPLHNSHELPELLSYIDGGIEARLQDRNSDLRNPNNEEPIQGQLSCTTEQVERALAATDAAYQRGDWENTPAAERAEVLEAIAAGLEAPGVAERMAAGAPCIMKPSEWAPHSALIMAELIHSIGLPRGTFQLTCGSRDIGGQMVSDPQIKAVSFTGGTAGGRAIARACADDFKPTQLELGGNNPLVARGGQLLQSTPMPDVAGYFIPPTLVDGCDPADTVEEIFGPVAAVHSFGTEAEALQLANGIDYGLAAYVYSQTEERAHAFSRQIRTGGVKINGYSLLSLHPEIPRGAWGLSGLGEEGTAESILFFTGARVVGLSPQDAIGGR